MNFQNQRQFRKQELMSKLMAKLRQLKKITMSLDDLVQPGALDSSDEMNRQYSQLSLGSSSSEAQESIESSDRGIEINFDNRTSTEFSYSDDSLPASPQRAFKPPQCPYRKKHKYTISRHSKSHSFQENYCHCSDCGKGFASTFDLLYHQKFMNLKNSDWVCDCCGSRFAEKYQFYGSSEEDDILNEECGHCLSQFACKNELNVHIITKHFKANLYCEIPDCSSKFRQTDHFIRHLKTTHRQLDKQLVKDLLDKVMVLVPDYEQLKYV